MRVGRIGAFDMGCAPSERCSAISLLAVLFFAAGVLCSCNAFADPICGRDAAALTPGNWALLAQAHGDLGGDGISDIALVAEAREPSGYAMQRARRLILADFRRELAEFCVTFTDDAFIAAAGGEFMEEPFGPEGLLIDRGSLLLSFGVFMSAGSWDQRGITYRFRRTSAGMRLIGYDLIAFSRATHAKSTLSLNLLTGKLQESSGPVPSARSRKRCPLLAAREVLMADIADPLSFLVDDSTCVQENSSGARRRDARLV